MLRTEPVDVGSLVHEVCERWRSRSDRHRVEELVNGRPRVLADRRLLERAIDEQAKGLLGADLIITGRSPLSEGARTYVDRLGAELDIVVAASREANTSAYSRFRRFVRYSNSASCLAMLASFIVSQYSR